MKIGLIGNMNNNNFSMMRYFRDLGVDAHLLLYNNDGKGALSHFKPQCDSWEFEKWEPYIHQTPIPNTPAAALDFPCSWFLVFWAMIRSWIGQGDGFTAPVSKEQIRYVYAGYTRLIASGISPATLLRANISLDIFYPYSSGVEFLRSGEFIVRFDGRFGLNRLIFSKVAQRQADGIKAARNVLNAEMGVTHDVLLDIGIRPLRLSIPMVYDKDRLPAAPPNMALQDACGAIANSDLTVLHQSRLMWRNPGYYSNDDWAKENKHNDWLLYAFAALKKERPDVRARLFIVEYGQDVAATRQLAAELGIESCLHWMPKMDRRELMWLLSRVTVGVGEFYDVPRMIWGGTGLEALASGKPLLQGFNFGEGEFEDIYGYPPPPMLRVRNQEDIRLHLLDMADHPEKREEFGRGAREWFTRHNGIGLAKQWLDILVALHESEGDVKKVAMEQGAHA